MKRMAYELVDAFQHLNFPPSHQREVKALAVAQALAYSIPIDPELTCEELCDQYSRDLKELVGAINERTPLDLRLCRSYFHNLVSVRYELLTGVENATLIKFLIKSELQAEHLTDDEAQLFKSFVSDRGFANYQRDVAAITSGVLGKAQKETPPQEAGDEAVSDTLPDEQ
jgi:hypothetical protein